MNEYTEPLFRVGGAVGGLRHFARHDVFRLIVLEGSGVPGDPYRNVTYWVLPEGLLLARFDPKVPIPEEER